MIKTIRRTILAVITFMLAFFMCGCTVKLSTSTTNTQVLPEDDTPVAVSYEELSLEKKMEYKSVIELEHSTAYDAELLAPALDEKTELWGYINLQGEWIISPSYEGANPFQGDYATVVDKYGDYTLINREGEVVLEDYELAPVSHIGKVSEEGIMEISAKVSYDQTHTYVNTEGADAVNSANVPITEGSAYETTKYFEIASPFKNGKAVVMRTTNATLAENGIDTYKETAYIIDAEGNSLATLPEGADVDAAGFDNNMLLIFKTADGKYGLADEEGNIVISAIYDMISHCEGSLYLAKRGSLYGFINKEGKTVIDFIYKDALPFSEGLAAVYDGEGWGFINQKGEIVIECQFDAVAPMNIASDSDGTASGAFSSGIAVVQKGRFWGIINNSGDIILAAEVSECPVIAIHNGYISFIYKDACGVFTTDGKYVLLPSYGSVGEFR